MGITSGRAHPLSLLLLALSALAPAASAEAARVPAVADRPSAPGGWSPWSNPLAPVFPGVEPERPAGVLGPAAPQPSGGDRSGMTVALNAGGWGPAAYFDVAGAAVAVRLESRFASDSEVGGAALAGVTVASWVHGTGGTIGSIDPQAYAAEVVTLFKRYGRGGTFWRDRPDLGGRAVEVLNEPGGIWFWSDPTNYAAYTNLLRVLHEQLAREFPAEIRPRVLASWDGGNGASSQFGEGWKAHGGLAWCDGVTVHPYGGSGGGEGGALGDRREVARAHAQSGKPVYVTEVGWPTDVGAPPTGDSQQWTEAQQAQNIAGFIGWARATRYVAMVVIFGLADYGQNNWYGIERADRSHKPSYAALAESQSAPGEAATPPLP